MPEPELDFDLHGEVRKFVLRWIPRGDAVKALAFVNELRALLEAYGKAALIHQSLPDVEHKHGDPV